MADERKDVAPHSVEGVVERAIKIYDEKYRERYERDHAGMFVVSTFNPARHIWGRLLVKLWARRTKRLQTAFST